MNRINVITMTIITISKLHVCLSLRSVSSNAHSTMFSKQIAVYTVCHIQTVFCSPCLQITRVFERCTQKYAYNNKNIISSTLYKGKYSIYRTRRKIHQPLLRVCILLFLMYTVHNNIYIGCTLYRQRYPHHNAHR